MAIRAPRGRTWFIFADESGNLDFRREGSRYFAIGSISLASDAERRKLRGLLDGLSDELLLSGFPVNGAFHASEDRQAVRDRVFPLLLQAEFTVKVTALEKAKVPLSQRPDDASFYKLAWQLHFRELMAQVAPGDQVHVIAATFQTKQSRKHFLAAVQDVVTQHQPKDVKTKVMFWRDESDRCLQAADYCLWAATRLLERGDSRAKNMLGSRLENITQPFAGRGRTYYEMA